MATLWEKANNQWTHYERIDGTAEYPFQVEPQFRGNSYNLTNWYHLYDWVGHDGYNNFSLWVK